jgi:general secretion pathway protein G
MNRKGAKGAMLSRSVSASADAGYTLLELLVVLGILTLLATVAAPQVLGYLGQARTQAAQVQVRNMSALPR